MSRPTFATTYARVDRERELAHEEGMRPRPRVDLLLDAQHTAEVATPHRHDVHPERFEGLAERDHAQALLVSQEISASLWRKYIGTTSAGGTNSSR